MSQLATVDGPQAPVLAGLRPTRGRPGMGSPTSGGAVGDEVLLAVEVAVGVAVSVGVGVAVSVAVDVAVSLGVAEGVFVGGTGVLLGEMLFLAAWVRR
jgi:hypothetical protein